MAKFTQDIRDVNVGSAGSPVGAVREQVASASGYAAAIGNVGRTVAQGAVDLVKTEQLQQGIQDQQTVSSFQQETAQNYEQFLSDQLDLSEDDKKVLKNFDDVVTKYKSNAEVSGKVDMFRSKMEKDLKQAIAANPHLSSELTRAASGSLGFNPIGEQLRQMEAADRASRTLLENQMNALDRQAQTFGYAAGAIFKDPSVQQEFLGRLDNKRATMQMQEQQAAVVAGYGDPLVYQTNYVSNLGKVVSSRRDDIFGDFANKINVLGKANGIDFGDIKSPLELTADQLAQITQTPNLRQDLVNQVEAYSQSLQTQLTQETAYFKDDSVRNSVLNAHMAPIKQLQSFLNGEITLKTFKDQVDMQKQLATNNLYQTVPQLAKIEATTNALGGLTALPKVSMDIYNSAGGAELMNSLIGVVKLDKNGTIVVNPAPPEPDTEVLSGLPKSEFNGMVEHFSNLVNSTTDNKEIVGAYLNQYGKIFSSPEVTKNKQVMESVFTLMRQPENKSALMDWMQENPELGQNMRKMYYSYVQNSVADISSQVKSLADDMGITYSTDYRSRSAEAFAKGAVKINYADGKFSLSVDEAAIPQLVAAQYDLRDKRITAARAENIRRDAQNKVNQWQSKYLNQLNNYIQDFSELSQNPDVQLVAKELVKGSAFESIFEDATSPQKRKKFAYDKDGNLVRVE